MSNNIQYALSNYADYLSEQSRQICLDNNCTEDNHNCESYAYFEITFENDEIVDIDLIDVCLPDYMIRSCNCAIPLPFNGNGKDLEEEINRYCDFY